MEELGVFFKLLKSHDKHDQRVKYHTLSLVSDSPYVVRIAQIVVFEPLALVRFDGGDVAVITQSVPRSRSHRIVRLSVPYL